MLYIQLVARDAAGTIVETKGNWMQSGDTPDWNMISMMVRDEITPADELEDEDDDGLDFGRDDFQPDVECPDCGVPERPGSHNDGCPRINSCGQIGPPWYERPWHSWDTFSDYKSHVEEFHGEDR